MTRDEFDKQTGRFRVEVVRDDGDTHWALRDTRTGEILGSDGGSPEDQLLIRDWAWVRVALNAVDAEREAAESRLAAARAEALEEAAKVCEADATAYGAPDYAAELAGEFDASSFCRGAARDCAAAIRALSEHDARVEAVEWKEREDENVEWTDATVGDCVLVIMETGARFEWSAERRGAGIAPTLDDAKRAAESAAGLRR